MAISLNDAELSALAGLPMLQVALYVLSIRPRMDFSSALVGVAPRISWQALGESLYVEPAPGIKGGSPDKSTLRRAAEGLERAGLIRNLSHKSRDKRQLVFRCLLANRGKSGQNKPDTKSTHQPDTPMGLSDAATVRVSDDLPPKADTPKTTKADIHQISDLVVIDTSSPIDTNQWGAGVIFHSIIKPEMRKATAGYLLQANPEIRQTMLDDLMGYISQQSAKGMPVANPAGIMRRMIERLEAGKYQPELDHIGAAMRQRERQQPATPAKAQPEKPGSSSPPISLKDFLKKGKS